MNNSKRKLDYPVSAGEEEEKEVVRKEVKLAKDKQPRDEVLLKEIRKLGEIPRNTELLRTHFNQLTQEELNCVFRERERHAALVNYHYVHDMLEHLMDHGNGEFVYWMCHGRDSKFRRLTCNHKSDEWLAESALTNGDFVTFDRFFKFVLCNIDPKRRDRVMIDALTQCIRNNAFDSMKYLLEFVDYHDLDLSNENVDKDREVFEALMDAGNIELFQQISQELNLTCSDIWSFNYALRGGDEWVDANEYAKQTGSKEFHEFIEKIPKKCTHNYRACSY